MAHTPLSLDLFALLGRTALFGGLDANGLAPIAAGTQKMRCGKGAILLNRGDSRATRHPPDRRRPDTNRGRTIKTPTPSNCSATNHKP